MVLVTLSQYQASRGIASEIWKQIPVGVKMSLGMRELEVITDGLAMRVGPSRPKRRLEITLRTDDLYEVRLQKWSQAKNGWVSEDSASGLYADQLGEILLWMESKNWG